MAIAQIVHGSIKARPGSRYSQKQAETIAPALFELAQQGSGQLSPAAVLEAARIAESPLHGFFNWDDASAAEERRLDIARHLIRSIVFRVVTVGDLGKLTREYTPAFVMTSAIDDAGKAVDTGSYTHVEQALSDEQQRAVLIAKEERVIRNAIARLETWKALDKAMGDKFRELLDQLKAADQAVAA